MANSDTMSFSVVSYNLHSLNQGESLLKILCSSPEFACDCICLQEHWLTPLQLGKLNNLSDNHTFFGISAMESVIQNSVLKGRPFGGVGIFLKNSFCNKVNF